MSTNDTFETLSALRDAVVSNVTNVEWAAKMMQPVPELPVVKDRAAYLVEKAKGKVVLDIGCTGPISQAIKQAALKYYGVDQAATADTVIDLDRQADELPLLYDVEVVICSEVLEHLANPGSFLAALRRYAGKEIYITVPQAGAYLVKDGCEVVNKDHVAWYSYTTLKTLLTRYEFEVVAARWYNGQPHKAEGLIFLVKCAGVA